MDEVSALKQSKACILTINGGSSSIKFALFDAGKVLQRILTGSIQRIGLAGAMLVRSVIDRMPGLGSRAAYAKQFLRNKLLDHKAYIDKYSQDMPEIRNWQWRLAKTGSPLRNQPSHGG